MQVAYINENMFIRERACLSCNYWRGNYTCKAFPTGIPSDIVQGIHSHTTSYPGDMGILYKGVGDPSMGLPNVVSEVPLNFFGKPQEPGKNYWGKPLKQGCNIYDDPIAIVKKDMVKADISERINEFIAKAGFKPEQQRDEKGRWTSGGAIPSKVKATHPDMVLNYKDMEAHIGYIKESYDWTDVKDAHNWLKTNIPEGELRIRADKDKAEDILTDGRFKAQYETGRSNGCYNPTYREDMEKKLFGENYTSNRPVIYGYLENKGVLNSTANSYGDVIFVLKDEVKARATFTVGDSLGSLAIPTPINNPAVSSVSYMDSYNLRSLKGSATITSINDKVGYIESQIHGGVKTTRDIERIHINNLHDVNGRVYQKASAAGIPIYVSNVKEYRYSFDSHAKDAVKVSDIIHDKRYKEPYYFSDKQTRYNNAYNALRNKELDAMSTRDNKTREASENQSGNVRRVYEQYEAKVSKYRRAVKSVSDTMDLYSNVDRIKTQMAGKQWLGPEW